VPVIRYLHRYIVQSNIIQLLTSDKVDLLIYQAMECDIGRGEYHIPWVDKSRGQPISEVNIIINSFIKLFENSINDTF
jgi:hypothetical protein